MSSGPSPYTVFVNVMGKVDPSVPRSLSQVSSQLKVLQAQVNMTSRAMRLGFSRLLGMSAGLVGITGIVSGMKEAVDLSQQNEQLQESLLVLLKNQRELRHQNAQLAVKDLQTLTAQAEKLQQQTGLYKNIFEQGSMILAKSHRNVQEIQSMQNSIANLVVAQRMQGRSAESMGEIYEAIGKSIETGMARNLNAIGVILTRREKQQLMINALTKNYSDSIRIVMGVIDRTYAGFAKLRMETLTGRTELAMNNMRASIEKMGNALKPVGQRMQIIFSQIVTLIEPVVVEVAKMVNDFLMRHMKQIREYIDYLRQKGIPIVIQWIRTGWGWFKDNKSWLLPLLKNITIGFAAWVTVIQPLVGIFTALTNPLTLTLTLITAIGTALGFSITNFKKFKGASTMFQDWLFGTERYKYDLSKEKFGAGKAHQVKRALPIMGGASQKGFLDDMVRATAKWVNNSLLPKVKEWLILMEPVFHDWVDGTLDWILNEVVQWLPKLTEKIDDWLYGHIPFLNELRKNPFSNAMKDSMRQLHNQIWNPPAAQQQGQTWQDSTTGHLFSKAPHAASDLTQSLTDLNKQVKKTEGNDFVHLNIQTDKLTEAFETLVTTLTDLSGNLGSGGGGGAGGAGAGYGGAGGGLLGASEGLAHAGPFPGAIRTMSEWVPGEPRTHATQYGPMGNKLQLGDIAMSTDLMAKMNLKLGDYVDILDKNNKMILAHQRIMDTSWLRPGVPTHGIELWGRKDIGWTKVVPSGTQQAQAQKKPDVTINYNVNHHHGAGTDLGPRLADIHRRHIDQMKRDIAQATYEVNRSRFDGSRSV